MPKKSIALALLAGVAALFLVTWANAVAPGPEPLPPYTGVIKNNTKHELSIYSKNSLGTIIVPPESWIEFVVWDENFDLIPYKEGDPYGCQKVRVTPDAISFKCKKYDFMAEINPLFAPTKKYYDKRKYKKRFRGKRGGSLG